MKFTSFFLILCFFATLQGNFEEHLKPVNDKSHYHQIRNIDFIYMINLDQRPEKFQKSQELLAPYGIYPYRFSAVNGWELTLETINDVGIKWSPNLMKGLMSTYYPVNGNFASQHELADKPGQNYFCHCMSRGAIGIVLSHLSILKDAYDSGYETIWVMEDDIAIIKDPQSVSTLIDELDRTMGKRNWDVLYTDRDTKARNGASVPCLAYAKRLNFIPQDPQRFSTTRQISPKFRKIGARYGTYSMVIRRSGIEKILNFYKKYDIFLPYDMDFFLINDIRLYTVLEDVLSTRIARESDNGAANYNQ